MSNSEIENGSFEEISMGKSAQFIMQQKKPSETSQLSDIIRIFKKVETKKTAQDQHKIQFFLHSNNFFKAFASKFGQDTTRKMLKNVQIIETEKDQIISRPNQKIQGSMIVLEGCLGLYSNLSSKQTYLSQIYQLQMLNLAVYIINQSRNADQQNKQNDPMAINLDSSNQQKVARGHSTKNNTNQNCEGSNKQLKRQVTKDEQIGIRQIVASGFYRYKIVSHAKSTLVFIPFREMFAQIRNSLKINLKQVLPILNNAQSFHKFDYQSMQSMMPFLNKKKLFKGQKIFKQGQKAESIYLLVEGQVKFVRQSDILNENPNQLYGDRFQIIKKFQEFCFKQDVKLVKKLGYTLASSLYTYRPVLKALQLGLCSSLSLVGQEQLLSSIYHTKRQTNLTVSSTQAVYYQLEVKKIKKHFPQKIRDFLNGLRKTSARKILYRQQILCQSLRIHSKMYKDCYHEDHIPHNNLHRISMVGDNRKGSQALRQLQTKDSTNANTKTRDTQASQQNGKQEEIQQEEQQSQFENPNQRKKLASMQMIESFLSKNAALKRYRKGSLGNVQFNINKVNQKCTNLISLQKNSRAKVLNQPEDILALNNHSWSAEKKYVSNQQKLVKKHLNSKQSSAISFQRPLFDYQQLNQMRRKSLKLQKQKITLRLDLPQIQVRNQRKRRPSVTFNNKIKQL